MISLQSFNGRVPSYLSIISSLPPSLHLPLSLSIPIPFFSLSLSVYSVSIPFSFLSLFRPLLPRSLLSFYLLFYPLCFLVPVPSSPTFLITSPWAPLRLVVSLISICTLISLPPTQLQTVQPEREERGEVAV